MNKQVGGFSFIQIIISVLLFTGLSVVTFKIRKQQVELGKSSSYAFESLSIIDKMKTLLSSPISCKASLKGMNPRFSQVEILRFQETSHSEVKVLFEETGIGGLVYGNNDVSIKSMTIQSSDDYFSIKNGYVLFKVRFEDIASSGKRFKVYSFPIHISLDDNGLISSCYSLEGFGALNTENEVGKWKLGQNQFIQIKTRSLNIGQVESKGELNIIGGLRLGLQYINCDKKSYGSLRYEREQGLLFCNERELWEKVHHENSLELLKESFVVKSKDLTKEKFMITKKSYAYCELNKSYFSSGRCYAKPVDDKEYRPRWKLAADLNNGLEMSCNFSCYK